MLEQSDLLDKLVDRVKRLVPIFEVERQVGDGVTIEEGQRTRDYCQSLVPGPVADYWPKVMISHATSHRDGLDGEGCGLGMQYASLVVRSLTRGGVSCFSGLHVTAGQDWVGPALANQPYPTAPPTKSLTTVPYLLSVSPQVPHHPTNHPPLGPTPRV